MSLFKNYILFGSNTLDEPHSIKECIEICKLLETDTLIKTVYLNYKIDGNKYCEELANLLKVNNTITKLIICPRETDMLGSRILCQNFNRIIDALKINNTVTHIKIYVDHINHVYCKYFADLLKVNNRLSHIKLCINYLNHCDYKNIIDSIKYNSSIIYVCVKPPMYPYLGYNKLRNYISRNKHNIKLKQMMLQDL
jgi:hypothetical protein